MKLIYSSAFLAVLFAASAIAGPNLLTNGSFETGDFTGWTLSGATDHTYVVSGSYYDYSGAEDGTYYAVLGAVPAENYISQTITDTPGQLYTFSFWFASVGDANSNFSASWDGTTLLNLPDDPDTGASWTEFSFTVMGTGSDTVQFADQDVPAYMALDNVSVSSATPEPASMVLLGTGLLAMGAVLRKRSRR